MTVPLVFAGFDLGTSGLKAALVDDDGGMLATAQASYRSTRPRGGRAEQDPADWIAALAEVVELLAREVPSGRWARAGLSGMIPTLVTEDADGEPIGPAITWEDDRAEEEGVAFREDAGAEALYRETGQWVDGRYLQPMMRWIERHEPDRATRTSRILSAKDHVYRWLTGDVATDPSTATGFGCYALATGSWNEGLAGRWFAKLPEVRPSSSAAPLSPAAAGAIGMTPGMPVVLGAADSVCGALGLGCVAAGDRASLWGTSTVILGVSDELAFDPGHRYLVTPLAHGDRWGLEMDLVSTGSAIAWAAWLLGLAGEAKVFELAERSSPGAAGLTFLPFLGFGEQGALWDPSLRGTMLGLTLLHGREDVARALLEGIAREFRRCVDVLADSGIARGSIRSGGGASESATFAQMLADASQVPVARPSVGRWASAVGAALLAASSAGAVDLDSAPSGGGDVVQPDGDARSVWEALAARHDAAIAAFRARG